MHRSAYRFSKVGCAAMLLTALAITSTLQSQTSKPTTQPTQQVSDAKGGYTFSIPADWVIGKPSSHDMSTLVLSPSDGPGDTFRENVNIVLVPLDAEAQQATIDAMTEVGVAGVIQAMNGKQIGTTRPVDVDGISARQVDILVQAFGRDLRSQQTYLTRGDLFYVVTYTSQADNTAHDAGAAGVLESWRFDRTVP